MGIGGGGYLTSFLPVTCHTVAAVTFNRLTIESISPSHYLCHVYNPINIQQHAAMDTLLTNSQAARDTP